jgi:hypothetical protein
MPAVGTTLEEIGAVYRPDQSAAHELRYDGFSPPGGETWRSPPKSSRA